MKFLLNKIFSSGLSVLVLLAANAAFAENKALPEPLTLEHALSLSDSAHPDNQLARNRLQRSQAERDNVAGLGGFQTHVEGRLRWVEPSAESFTPQRDDHYIGIIARKRLYDFGKTGAAIASADASIKHSKLLLQEQRLQQRIAIIRAYFDVILADLAYARDNEAMAIRFVRFDKIKHRNELKQVADADLLEAENRYHAARSVRYASDVRRRAARSQLANLLNRPGELSSNLIRPKLDYSKFKLPDVDKIQKRALDNNPVILALRQKLEAARKQLESSRALKKPTVDLQLEAAEYSRGTRISDPYRAGIIFQMPLGSSGAIDADIAKQQTLMRDAQAELRKAEMELKQRILDTWHALYVAKAKHDEADINFEYRDLELDRQRALYELDVNADLGDTLSQFAAALHQSAKADYELVLLWSELYALMGESLDIFKPSIGANP